MFKELKIIKLIVLVGLLAAILLKMDVLDLSIDQFCVDKTSYVAGDEVLIYATTKAPISSSKTVTIKAISGNEVGNVDLNLERDIKLPINVLKDGIEKHSMSHFQLPLTLKPGIYTIADRYPIVVKGNSTVDITVVYPLMNNLLYQKVKEASVFSEKIASTSFSRTNYIDEYTLGLGSFFNELENVYSVNYTTDCDLENNDFQNSKLLIIYGKSSFWTPTMRSNLQAYIAKGGNVLLMSSYALNNVCWYSKDKNEVFLYDELKSDAIESWLGYDNAPPRDIFGTSLHFGGKSDSVDYLIKEKKHTIFNGVEGVRLNATLYNSPPVTWNGNEPIIDSTLNKYYIKNILAYNQSITPSGIKGIKAIFEFQSDSTSGKIINLGAEDWCLEQKNDPSLQQITKNAIGYLLN